MTKLEKSSKFRTLSSQIGEIIKFSNQLNIPLSIAFEVDDNFELVVNDQCSGNQPFDNIKALYESRGDVTDFLLNMCKLSEQQEQQEQLNNVKSRNIFPDFTITNSQVLSTKH